MPHPTHSFTPDGRGSHGAAVERVERTPAHSFTTPVTYCNASRPRSDDWQPALCQRVCPAGELA